MPIIKRKPGGQPGNQNARTHGFYSQVLDEAEQLDIKTADDLIGIDDEIALLRAKIKSVLRNDPQNVQLIIRATESLSRLIKAKYKIDKA